MHTDDPELAARRAVVADAWALSQGWHLDVRGTHWYDAEGQLMALRSSFVLHCSECNKPYKSATAAPSCDCATTPAGKEETGATWPNLPPFDGTTERVCDPAVSLPNNAETGSASVEETQDYWTTCDRCGLVLAYCRGH